MVYLIGSLRNPRVPEIAKILRERGFEVFDDWHAAGPTADDEWRKYEEGRGHTYQEALDGHAAEHVFAFDKTHLDRATEGVLVLPAGRSCHLEAGYLAGQGKPVFVLLDPTADRWDVMYKFMVPCWEVEELPYPPPNFRIVGRPCTNCGYYNADSAYCCTHCFKEIWK